MAGKRRFVVGGNLKANGTVEKIDALVDSLNKMSFPGAAVVEVVMSPPFLYLPHLKEKLRPEFKVAAQDVWIKGDGAYTGEITANMLKDFGIPYTITGHSERRTLCGETSQIVADKTEYAISLGLDVIVCIGETLDEREAGNTMDVVAAQLAPLKGFSAAQWEKIVLAYEPVWAIGTGKTASPAQAQEVHAFIRKWLADNVSAEVSAMVPIQYGGSVTGANCEELAQQPDIDGFLVGGASWKPEFEKIINAGALSK